MRKEQDIKPESGDGLELLAKKVATLGLVAPVSLLLELHKPISSIIHTSLLAGEPFGRLFGIRAFDNFTHLFSSRSNIDHFLQLLENYSIAQKTTGS